MIRIDRLEVRRNGRIICRVPRLDVEPGERLGIVGANGSGKSTLLIILAGLEQATRGRCEVSAPVEQRVYVHQQPYLFRGTVLSNATYGLRSRAMPRGQANQTAMRWLTRLGIREQAYRRVDNLSGGERRRVALARALAIRPMILLLDEPLADLDEQGSETVSSILNALDDVTVLIASPTDLPHGLTTRTYTITQAISAED